MSNCILYELTKLIEEWEYSIDDLDNIKILELCTGGAYSLACQNGCQQR